MAETQNGVHRGGLPLWIGPQAGTPWAISLSQMAYCPSPLAAPLEYLSYDLSSLGISCMGFPLHRSAPGGDTSRHGRLAARFSYPDL